MRVARSTFALGMVLSLGTAVGLIGQTTNPGGPLNQNLGEPNYGVCRGTDPACYHNWGGLPTEPRVLVWSRTAGPRHDHLGTPLAKGLNPPLNADNIAQAALVRLAKENGIGLDYTEYPAEFRQLTRYNAVIFMSPTRDNLDDGMQTTLRQYIRRGGGFVAIHNAFGAEYNWPYYEGLLGNANFYDHGPNRDGDLVIVNKKDESTKGLPERIAFRDEFYNLVPFPTQVRFLATVDEKSFKVPARTAGHPGHGSFHPVAWCQYYDGGRAWMTTLGHDVGAYSADHTKFPGAAEFQKLIVGGIKSAAGMVPFCQG